MERRSPQRQQLDADVAARELADEERAAAWQVMLRTWPNFATYEKRTDRLIPVFELTVAP